MNSNRNKGQDSCPDCLTMQNSTFAQRQAYADSLKAYDVVAEFDGLIVAIDHSRPDYLFISDRQCGLLTGIDYKGESFELDCFKMISKIHLDTLRNRIYDCCPNWYEREFDKPNKGWIKEVIQFIKDNHPSNKQG